MRREEMRRVLVACDGVSALREVFDAPAVGAMTRVLEALSEEDASPREVSGAVSGLLSELAAGDERLLPDAWKTALIKAVLDSETLFGRRAERSDLTPLIEAQAARDLASLQRLFTLDSKALLAAAVKTSHETGDPWTNWNPGGGEDDGSSSTSAASAPLSARREMAVRFSEAGDWASLAGVLGGYFPVHGSGEFGVNRAFGWRGGRLVPVAEPDPVGMGDLFGYERERGLVHENTRRFLAGLPAHHALLYGPPGTGKSATVKAVAKDLAGEGLRLVEVSKDRLEDLPDVLEALRGRGLRFIVFVDDLSFEEGEVEYKSLKAVIEGSIESPPANVRLYATSNRRNLVRETFSEREGDDVHARDTMGEKLSLAARFGLRVTFPAPDRETYLEIVRGIARSRGIELSDESLERGAMRREQWSGGKSARSARQFVDELETGADGSL